MTLRQTAEQEKKGIFVAEGEKVVARLVESDLQIDSVLTTPEWFKLYRARLESKPDTIKVFVGDKALLNSIVGFHLHQGIMAVAKIPQPIELQAIVQQSRRPLLLVAIDGMTNSENLGVLVRNCAAFGVQGLIVGERTSSPYLRRAVRNSMGTVFRMAVVATASLVQTLKDLQYRFGVHVIAAHPHSDQDTMSSVDFRRDCCLVFGSEGYGISKEVLAACEEASAIPMQAGVDSLNVSSASAVFLYEVMRQRFT